MNKKAKTTTITILTFTSILAIQLSVKANDDKYYQPDQFGCKDKKGVVVSFGSNCILTQFESQCMPNSCPSGTKKAEL
jgi:hypothetical protein